MLTFKIRLKVFVFTARPLEKIKFLSEERINLSYSEKSIDRETRNRQIKRDNRSFTHRKILLCKVSCLMFCSVLKSELKNCVASELHKLSLWFKTLLSTNDSSIFVDFNTFSSKKYGSIYIDILKRHVRVHFTRFLANTIIRFIEKIVNRGQIQPLFTRLNVNRLFFTAPIWEVDFVLLIINKQKDSPYDRCSLTPSPCDRFWVSRSVNCFISHCNTTALLRSLHFISTRGHACTLRAPPPSSYWPAPSLNLSFYSNSFISTDNNTTVTGVSVSDNYP